VRRDQFSFLEGKGAREVRAVGRSYRRERAMLALKY
jgi:hypothetical protein